MSSNTRATDTRSSSPIAPRVIGLHPLPPLFGERNKEAEAVAASGSREDVKTNRGKKDVMAIRSKKDIKANPRAVINTPMTRAKERRRAGSKTRNIRRSSRSVARSQELLPSLAELTHTRNTTTTKEKNRNNLPRANKSTGTKTRSTRKSLRSVVASSQELPPLLAEPMRTRNITIIKEKKHRNDPPRTNSRVNKSTGTKTRSTRRSLRSVAVYWQELLPLRVAHTLTRSMRSTRGNRSRSRRGTTTKNALIPGFNVPCTTMLLIPPTPTA